MHNFNNYIHFSYFTVEGYYDDLISQQERDTKEYALHAQME